MSDSTREPERQSAESGGDSSGLGRRTFLLGGGAIGALALGGTGVYLATTSGSQQESSYLLQQGYLRYEVNPISKGDATIEQFYDYQTSSASPEGDIIKEDAASRMFIYDGPVDSSLVFLHGSPNVDHGGTAFFAFSGLGRDQGEWAVRDDPIGTDDDYELWEEGNQKVDWEWGPGQTDGGAFWGALDREDFSITVNPKTLRGVDSWTFHSGELGQLTSYDLYQGEPAKLKPARGRSVKRANVDIMPDSAANEFDPYSTELLTVAVEQPPDGADDREWVGPDDLDPGNYAVNFGSKSYLAGQNAAQPQKYFTKGGTLYLKYKTKAANFTLDSAYGYLVSKVGEKTYVRGRDVVHPGGFDNLDEEQPELVITELHVDTDGADERHLVDEYIEFENDGDEKLDLTDYTIRDAEGWAFYMPNGFVLEPGDRFRLHTGDKEWTDSDLYWDVDHPVWDNDGDTVIVLDDSDDVVLEYTYPRQ